MSTDGVTIAQEGTGNAKLHPYVVALVRWCVSCIWGTATVLLHRLVTAQLPLPLPSTIVTPAPPAPKSPQSCANKLASHIDPEPRVQCVVLHEPVTHTLDIVFVHGLYGSLENTWRQGDWRPKYKIEPNRIPLRRPHSMPTTCSCEKCDRKSTHKQIHSNTCACVDIALEKEQIESCQHQKTIDKESCHHEESVETLRIMDKNIFSDESFLNYDQIEIVDNYEAQARFVRDLFCYNECDSSEVDTSDRVKNCEVGCGCICDKCYSNCWPKDWLSVDYPNARIISINYTSDPYLWRPLWVKECKRLRLHERAEQMTHQLLALGVGQRPVVWVGHSKGGLFIKQIYAEAYEAYLKSQTPTEDHNCSEYTIDNELNLQADILNKESNMADASSENNSNLDNACNDLVDSSTSNEKIIEGISEKEHSCDILKEPKLGIITAKSQEKEVISSKTIDKPKEKVEILAENNELKLHVKESQIKTNNVNEFLKKRASLWSNSTGFMFYSVPHRGSALADIKTPITARSIELLEISKDCSLVLSLQARWLRATEPLQPVVRSLVETNRTLMSVLWLRIVSVESADAGIGALCGVSVDHREICKPSSRSCVLYTELLKLIRAAQARWRCQGSTLPCSIDGDT